MTFEGNYENYQWYSSWQDMEVLKDAWNEFTIELPEDLDMTLEQQIGVQCETIGEGNFTYILTQLSGRWAFTLNSILKNMTKVTMTLVMF